MKKLLCGRRILLLFIALFMVAAGIFALKPAAVSADAAGGAYSFTIKRYDVEMAVSSDRTIDVKETITAAFTGYDAHGIIRDFPLGDGVRYQNISATCDNPDFAPYTQTDDISILSLYLRGDGWTRGETRTYTLTYQMIVPALAEEGYLPIDVIGYGWQAIVQNVTVKVTVPEGLNDYKVYSGLTGTTGDSFTDGGVREGNVITITADSLPYESGITLDLSFRAGALSEKFDMAVIYALLIGAVLLVLAVLVKMFVCRQPVMTTTVNLEAPERMDPLKMGKLIDNKVDSEDLGALIFYFADQGYLHIDLTENEKNPTLYKTEKAFPPDGPAYLREMYEGLFSGRESVRVSDLTNQFYRTSERVIRSVNATSGTLYSKKSKFLVGLFGVLAVLLLGGFAWLYSMLMTFSGYMYWGSFVICGIACLIAGVAANLAAQREFKWKKAKKILATVGGILLGCLVSCVFLLLPSAAFTKTAGFLLGVFSALVGSVCGGYLCRTEEYTAQLGQILGFKQFILYTERDKIEFMLKENPEFYYHILPYAQVLGVTDAWTDKFKGLDLKPPTYASYNTTNFVFDCMVWNSLFRSMNSNLARNMVSRPSSSSHAGGHGGGFGGGFGGGGFGGGGGRGC